MESVKKRTNERHSTKLCASTGDDISKNIVLGCYFLTRSFLGMILPDILYLLLLVGSVFIIYYDRELLLR